MYLNEVNSKRDALHIRPIVGMNILSTKLYEYPADTSSSLTNLWEKDTYCKLDYNLKNTMVESSLDIKAIRLV